MITTWISIANLITYFLIYFVLSFLNSRTLQTQQVILSSILVTRNKIIKLSSALRPNINNLQITTTDPYIFLHEILFLVHYKIFNWVKQGVILCISFFFNIYCCIKIHVVKNVIQNWCSAGSVIVSKWTEIRKIPIAYNFSTCKWNLCNQKRV